MKIKKSDIVLILVVVVCGGFLLAFIYEIRQRERWKSGSDC